MLLILNEGKNMILNNFKEIIEKKFFLQENCFS